MGFVPDSIMEFSTGDRVVVIDPTGFYRGVVIEYGFNDCGAPRITVLLDDDREIMTLPHCVSNEESFDLGE